MDITPAQRNFLSEAANNWLGVAKLYDRSGLALRSRRQARRKAIEECIEVVRGRVEHYRTRAATTDDFELADKREYGAEVCEWMVTYLRALLSESKT